MIDVYIILVGITLFILYQCKYLSLNYLKSFKWLNLCKNIWFIVPIITMYLEKDSISKFMHNSNNSNNSKRKLSETTKKVVAANQQWSCKICNRMLDASYEVDHINPLYKGGTNDITNLQALCRNCHGKKTINDKLNI
jgi:5-methylcytosine-specific restriction enzyme A